MSKIKNQTKQVPPGENPVRKDGVEAIENADGTKVVKIKFFVRLTDTVDYRNYLSDPLRNSKPYLV